MWMSPNQLFGYLPCHVFNVEVAGFTRDFAMHNDVEKEVAEFFAKMRDVFGAGSFNDLVGFFDQLGQDGQVGLFPVPRTTSRRSQACDDFAQLIEGALAPRWLLFRNELFRHFDSSTMDCLAATAHGAFREDLVRRTFA